MLMIFVLSACGGNPTPPASTSTPTDSPPTSAPASAVPVINPPAPTDAPIAANPPSNPPGCTDHAAFVADVTVQDNELFQPGQKFAKVWRVKNAGTCNWTPEYRLAFSGGNRMDAAADAPLAETLAGSTLDIRVEMTAPNDGVLTQARADFEIRNPAGEIIPIDTGTTLWVIIQIANALAPTQQAVVTSETSYASAACHYTLNVPKVNELIAALTAYRAKYGLPPFNIDTRLNEAAQAHSADMACNQLFYHNGSNGSTPTSRVAASGYPANSVTENVYGSYPPLTSQDVIIWWANDTADPRHNENLLSTRYVDIGIGYSFYNNYGYFVIDFAVP